MMDRSKLPKINKRGLRQSDRNPDPDKKDSLMIDLANNRIISEEHGDITHIIVKRLQQRIFEATLRAPMQQQELARVAALKGERCAVGDLGQVALEIHPSVYWHWRFREGPEAWGDKGFRKDLVRDNPELAVKNTKKMNQIGFIGSPVKQKKPVHTGKTIYQG